VYDETGKYRMNLSTAKDKFAYDNESKIGLSRISELAETIPAIYLSSSLRSNARESSNKVVTLL